MVGYSTRISSACAAALAEFAILAFAAISSRGAEPPLAISGYDAVAYFTQGRAAPGDPHYEYVWDDARYRFISFEHRELFKEHPEQYAPQFPGYCAMSLADGVKVEPNPENWLISGGKLYLFGKSIGPGKFSGNFEDNVTRANANWRRVQQGEVLAGPDQPQ